MKTGQAPSTLAITKWFTINLPGSCDEKEQERGRGIRKTIGKKSEMMLSYLL